MSIESNSNLGGIGALLIVLTSVFSFLSFLGMVAPSATILLFPISMLSVPMGLAGVILFLVSMHGLAQAYKRPSIFNNALGAFLTIIVGVIVIFGVAFVLVIVQLSQIMPTLNPVPATPNMYPEILQSLMGVFTPVFVASAVVGLISTLLLMRAFNRLAEKSGERRFRTAGLLFPISAVISAGSLGLAAVLATAGSLPLVSIWAVSLPAGAVQLAAWVMAVSAFFRLKANARANQAAAPPASVWSAGVQIKYCPFCGAQNSLDAVYCTRCGKQM